MNPSIKEKAMPNITPVYTIEIAGKQYPLRYRINDLVMLEEVIGRSISTFEDQKPGIRELRAVLWAGLRHVKYNMSLEDAGNLMDEADDMQYLFTELGKALEKTFGPKNHENVGDTGNAKSPAPGIVNKPLESPQDAV